jgi:hypothetical protein
MYFIAVMLDHDNGSVPLISLLYRYLVAGTRRCPVLGHRWRQATWHTQAHCKVSARLLLKQVGMQGH